MIKQSCFNILQHHLFEAGYGFNGVHAQLHHAKVACWLHENRYELKRRKLTYDDYCKLFIGQFIDCCIEKDFNDYVNNLI